MAFTSRPPFSNSADLTDQTLAWLRAALPGNATLASFAALTMAALRNVFEAHADAPVGGRKSKHKAGGAASKPLAKGAQTPATEAATRAVRHVFQQILLQRKKVYDRCGVPIKASHLAHVLAITTNSAPVSHA